MNKAPWIFLGVLFTLGLSWWGMVYGPATQLGNESADLGGGQALKPRVGLAQQGEQVYRENGCYYCHTRTAASGEFGYELQLTKLGDDRDATLDALGSDRMKGAIEQAFWLKEYAAAKSAKDEADKAYKAATDAIVAEGQKPPAEQDMPAKLKAVEVATEAMKQAGDKADEAKEALKAKIKDAKETDTDSLLVALGLGGLDLTPDFGDLIGLGSDPSSLTASHTNAVKSASITITKGTEQWAEIETVVRKLKTRAGAQFKLQPVAGNWPDVVNGLAPRQSVSRDFLFDHVAMPGVMRLGPDLSNVGARLVGDDAKHFAHLYDARSTVAKSKMPPYRYLFTREAIGKDDALPAGAFEMTEGEGDDATRYAVTPTVKARALLAYLRSLRIDRKLPEAPLVETRAAAAEEN